MSLETSEAQYLKINILEIEYITIWCLLKTRIYSLLVKFLRETASPWKMIFYPPSTFYFPLLPYCPVWWHPFSPYIDPIHACMLSVHLITIVCVCDYLTSGHKIKVTIVLSSWHTLTMNTIFLKNFLMWTILNNTEGFLVL